MFPLGQRYDSWVSTLVVGRSITCIVHLKRRLATLGHRDFKLVLLALNGQRTNTSSETRSSSRIDIGSRRIASITRFQGSLNKMRLLNRHNVTRAVQNIHQPEHHQIEVERKFVPTADFSQKLRLLMDRHNSSASTKGPKAVVEAQELKIQDTYYEWDDKLWRIGVWVRFRTCTSSQDPRLRSGAWNAKLRLEGAFTNSRMVEVHGEPAVEDLLQRHAPGATLSDLTAYAKFVTVRQAWKIPVPFLDHRHDDGWEMEMVLDTTTTEKDDMLEARLPCFHHEVGEIELTKETPVDSAKASLDREARKMDSHLQWFMSKHNLLFDSGRQAMGKLEAFTRWKTAQANTHLP